MPMMNNHLSRRPLLVFVLILFLFTLAACQAAPDSTPTSTLNVSRTPASSQAAAQTKLPAVTPSKIPATPTPIIPAHLQITPEALKDHPIRFWHPFTGDAALVIEDLVDEFNRTNVWGIQVDSRAAGSSAMLYRMVKDTLGGQDMPNVIVASQDALGEFALTDNRVIELESYLDDPRWGMSADEIAAYYPEFWQEETIAGRRIGIPALRNARVMYYNLTWGQELGFDTPPTTVDEFKKQACAAARANKQDGDSKNDGTGGWIIGTDGQTALSWMYAFGLEPISQDAQESIHLAGPESEQAFYYLRGLFDENCAWLSRDPRPYEYFATRQALFYSGTLQELPVQDGANSRAESGDRWTVIPFPVKEQEPFVLSSGFSYAIMAASPQDQMASWMLLRWLTISSHEARLVSASSTWPVTRTADKELSGYRKENPLWGQTLLWIPTAIPAPTRPGWRLAQTVIEDAAWQLFQANTKAEMIPDTLKMADDTISEVIQKIP